MIADDSGLMRGLLASALGRSGIAVVGVAGNGDEAIECCERLAPDVLSLDLAMPGRNGVGVLRELRARNLHIPVVVVSAFAPQSGARAVDALAEGAFDLVAKPRSREELQKVAGLKHRMHFQKSYLEPLMNAGWLQMTIPGKPKSRLQRYRTTPTGAAAFAEK